MKGLVIEVHTLTSLDQMAKSNRQANSLAATADLLSDVFFVLGLSMPLIFGAFILSMIVVTSCLLIDSVFFCLWEGRDSACCWLLSCLMLSDLICLLTCLLGLSIADIVGDLGMLCLLCDMLERVILREELQGLLVSLAGF